MKPHDNYIERTQKLCSVGYELSQSFAGIIAPNKRMGLSTHFLARIMDSYMTLFSLQSDDKLNLVTFLDFSSVASVSRNIIEVCNLNFYLAIEKCSPEETDIRFLIFDYHSLCELIFVIENMFPKKKELKKLKIDQNNRINVLQQNTCFQSLDKQLQKNILNGKRGAILTQYEIVSRRNIDSSMFKAMYKIMSAQLHSNPFALNQFRLFKMDGAYEKHYLFFSEYLTQYTNFFIAKTIQEIGSLWDMKYSNSDSEKFVNECAKMF